MTKSACKLASKHAKKSKPKVMDKKLKQLNVMNNRLKEMDKLLKQTAKRDG